MGGEEKESLEERVRGVIRRDKNALSWNRVESITTTKNPLIIHHNPVLYCCIKAVKNTRLRGESEVPVPRHWKLNAFNNTPTAGVYEFSPVYTWLPGAVHLIYPSESMSRHGWEAESRDCTAPKVFIFPPALVECIPVIRITGIRIIPACKVIRACILFWFYWDLADTQLSDSHEGWIEGVG
ncbi:hypothetical protein BD779DRAFT_1476930 [Infundibulicybe gibba]|nr:hypothetical protein BD779DRAFT_1476930 [Infundibulicybe gibba]